MRKLGLALLAFLSLGAASAHAQNVPPPKPGTTPNVPPPKPTEPAPAPEPVPVAEPAPAPAPVATVVGGAYSKTNWPPEWTLRPQQLAPSMIEIRVNLVASLGKDAVFKPFSLSPDLYYGVNDKLQLGLVHSGFAFGSKGPGSAGGALCVTGKSKGCAKVYNNVGVDALYALSTGNNEFSGHGSLNFTSLDPMYLNLGLGLAGKMRVAPQMALSFDPQLFIGLTKRTTKVTIAGMTIESDTNKEFIVVPVAFHYQVNPQFAGGIHTGISGQLSKFGDTSAVPVGLVGLFNVNQMIDVGLRFTLDNVTPHKVTSATGMKVGPGAADYRTLALVVNVRP